MLQEEGIVVSPVEEPVVLLPEEQYGACITLAVACIVLSIIIIVQRGGRLPVEEDPLEQLSLRSISPVRRAVLPVVPVGMDDSGDIVEEGSLPVAGNL